MNETQPAPAPQDRLTDDTMAAEMSAVYDRAQEQTRDADRESPPVPIKESMSIDERLQAWSEWQDRPIEERREIVGAQAEIERRKAEAEKFGITLAEREMITQAASQPAATPSELAPGLQVLAELYPEQKPAAMVEWYGKVDRYMRSDPEAGLRWLAEQMGYSVDPVRIEQ